MHRSTADLEESLDQILDAPEDNGRIEMIVRRPNEDEREVIDVGELNGEFGLVGDNWSRRGQDDRQSQITLMSSRVVAAMSDGRHQWPLAGDQIYVDMDLSVDNLPSGARLSLGDAVIQISEIPHTGCQKFASRFGAEALRFANIGEGKARRFRGVYAWVVEDGMIRTGDKVSKL